MEENKIKLEQPADPTTETFNPNVKGGNSWQELTGKPDAYVLNQINKDGIVERIDAKTIRSGKITGTTLQTGESGARVIIGGSGDDSNDIHLLDDSTGGTTPITGNTASINFKRTDDNTQIFKIQKRSGINHDSENIMEFYYDKLANDGQKNYIFLGRKGDDNISASKTDIIQLNAKNSLQFFVTNAYDAVADAGQGNVVVNNTDGLAGANAGGTRVAIQAHRADTDSGASDGAYIAFNIFNNGSSTVGNTWLYIDSNGVNLVSNDGTQSGILGVNDSTGALQWNGVDIT